MNTKRIIVYGLIILLSGVLTGYEIAESRFSPATTKSEAKEVNHTKTVITTTKKPDGTVTTVEVVDSKTKLQANTATSTPTGKKQITNVSVLVSNDFSKSPIIPLYGISVSRELVGPFTVGAFGLTNGTVGVSIGINF